MRGKVLGNRGVGVDAVEERVEVDDQSMGLFSEGTNGVTQGVHGVLD